MGAEQLLGEVLDVDGDTAKIKLLECACIIDSLNPFHYFIYFLILANFYSPFSILSFVSFSSSSSSSSSSFDINSWTSDRRSSSKDEKAIDGRAGPWHPWPNI